MIFRQVADLLTNARGSGWRAKQFGFATGYLDYPKEYFDQSGLARAVLAEQTIDLTFLDFESNFFECLNATVFFAEFPRLDNRHARLPVGGDGLHLEWNSPSDRRY